MVDVGKIKEVCGSASDLVRFAVKMNGRLVPVMRCYKGSRDNQFPNGVIVLEVEESEARKNVR